MKNMSYEAALEELQGIVEELQGEQVSIDELQAKSERAQELLAYCRAKLRDLDASFNAPKVNSD